MEMFTDTPPPVNPAPSKRRRGMIAGGVFVGALAVGVLGWLMLRPLHSPVPADIRKSAGFTVYYPDQKRLPDGYTLDTTSFRMAQPGVVVFAVLTSGKQLIFSEEQSPDTATIDKFTSTYIPLHTELSTALGKGLMGAAGQGEHLQSVVSLPVTRGPWVIVTAPANSKQSDMQQVLQSLTK